MKQFNFSSPRWQNKQYYLTWYVLLLIFSSFTLQAQTVKGVIKSESNVAIPGATVLVKGTTRGTTANSEGVYSISASTKETLVFSSIGYKTKEVTVGNSSTLDIVLEEDQSTLNEVVVVGYGTQRKRDVTGAVVSINEATLKEVPAPTCLTNSKDVRQAYPS